MLGSAGSPDQSKELLHQLCPSIVRSKGIHKLTSSLVFCWVRKHPNIVLVTVVAPGFWTPRIDMHMWLLISFNSCACVMPERDQRSKYLLSLHNNRDAPRPDRLLHGQRDLLRQALLDLQPPRERLCDPRELRQAQYKLVGDIADRDLRIRSAPSHSLPWEVKAPSSPCQ